METLQERLGLKRPAAALAAGCGVALFIQGIVSDWMDVVSIYICPFGGRACRIMFFWVAGKDVAVDAVNRGRKRKLEAGLFPLESMCWFQLRLLH